MPNHRNTAEGFWARLDRSAGADDGRTYVAIARLHGVSPQTAACVAKRSTWAHVA